MSVDAIKLRSDLVFSQQRGPEGGVFVVKDPLAGRFFRFREIEYFIARQLDGATPLPTVQQHVEERFDATLSLEELDGFVERLRRSGLLADADSEHGAGRAPPRRVAGDLFYLRFRAFDPDRLFERLAGSVGWLFTRRFVLFSAVLIVASILVTLGNRAEIHRELAGLFQAESLLLAWLTMLVVITLHEFAHGVTCKHFGGHVHELGFMLIYFQPAFYCNVSDSWLFPEKSKRLWVTFAGAYFEMFLWAISAIIWRLTDPTTTIHHLALIVMATSAVKSLFNLNPLIKLDGYYLLSDLLDVPNLRRRAFEYLRVRCKRLVRVNTDAPPNHTPKERRIYLVYGLLAVTYTYGLLVWIASRVGSFLVERYEAWGFVTFAVLIGGLFRAPLNRTMSAMRGAARSGKPRAARRLVKSVAILGMLWVALYLWRVELKVAGEFTILPLHNADVRAEVGGVIVDIPHGEGEVVRRGAVIAKLGNPDLQAESRKMAAEVEEKEAQLKMLEAGPRHEEIEVARTAAAGAEERLKYARSRFERTRELFDQGLVSRVEFDATEEEVATRQTAFKEASTHLKMLLAGSRPEQVEALQAELNRLKVQQGYLNDQVALLTVTSPVDGVVTTRRPKEKVGQFVVAGDLICEVYELDTVNAEIAISEKDISEVKVGQRVVLRARAYTRAFIEGTVTSISPTASGAEDIGAPRTVLVVTRLDNTVHALRPATSGRAKIHCGERRALDLLSRRFLRYLRVEFWSWW